MLENPQVTPRILVTTDFSEASQSAFYHALAFTVRRHGRLTLLHTGPESGDSVPWEQFPGVRETLAGWGLLAPDAPRSAVADQLDIGIGKIAMRDSDPRQGIADYLRRHPVELLIMATEGRNGLARLFNPSVAESICYRTRMRTLLLPRQGTGFVDSGSGRSALKRVLCALDPAQDLRPHIAFLRDWLPMMAGEETVQVTLLQDPETVAPEGGISLPQDSDAIQWHQQDGHGDITTMLLDAVQNGEADLLVVNTEKRLGMRGRMRGSRIDRLLKKTGLPLLTLPPIRM